MIINTVNVSCYHCMLLIILARFFTFRTGNP
jgi:hypothetical protein